MREWTTELLDEMARTGDPLAEEAVRQACFCGEVPGISTLFKSFAAEGACIAADAPQPFHEFVARTASLPQGIDLDAVERGAGVMLRNATLCALILLLKSLPAGYAAPRLSSVLNMTQNLEQRPYRRALGVLQMLVNISQPHAFQPGGPAIVTAQKLRLLHAGVRHVVGRHIPWFATRWGTPVSQLDMAFTIMTFSVHVIDGMAALGVRWPRQDAEDFFHFWRMYGELQGVRPEWMPATIEEGRAFCEAYAREFRSAGENPHGVALTRADLKMMKSLVPWPLRAIGLGGAPTAYLLRLLGREAAARVGVKRKVGHRWADWLALRLPPLWHRLWRTITPDGEVHEEISRYFFRTLIIHEFGREVTFTVPRNLSDLRRLA